VGVNNGTKESLAKLFICGSTGSPRTGKINQFNVPTVHPEPVEGQTGGLGNSSSRLKVQIMAKTF